MLCTPWALFLLCAHLRYSDKQPHPKTCCVVGSQSGGPSAFPEPPALLAEEDGLRLWAKTDTAFGVPRTVACLLLSSPRGDQPERAAALTHLVVKLLEAGDTCPGVHHTVILVLRECLAMQCR